MKKLKWQGCLDHGSIVNHPPDRRMILQPLNTVEPGMHIIAKFNDLDVHLRIREAKNQDHLTAEVLYFEPVLAKKPKDLEKGDEVVIDRQHICWIHDD